MELLLGRLWRVCCVGDSQGCIEQRDEGRRPEWPLGRPILGDRRGSWGTRLFGSSRLVVLRNWGTVLAGVVVKVLSNGRNLVSGVVYLACFASG